MGGECVGPCVGDVAPTYDIPVGRPHVADGFPHVGDVAPTYDTPHVGDVAPTYDTPVGRPHVADGFLDPPCTP